MKVLTVDNRLLYLVMIGEVDKEGNGVEKGSDNILCRDEKGSKVTIKWSDVKLVFGSFLFPTVKYDVKLVY